jgi:antitoxin component HigA of HigAB toxin-antitoxin module
MITLCALCNTEFEARTSYGLCKNCWSKDRLREWDRLESAKKSIRRLGVPTSLTLVEWLSIVSDFQGRCAYCLVSNYFDMEMANPRLGLVRANVIPCCRSCQIHKHHTFDVALERVQAYLDSDPTVHAIDDEAWWEMEAI